MDQFSSKTSGGPSSASLFQAPHCVLVVEDDEEVRNLLCLILKNSGFEVLEAKSADEVLTSWSDFEPRVNLVLTDLILKTGITGVELKHRVNVLKPSVKVMYITGCTNDTLRSLDPEAAEELSWINKPFTVSGLVAQIRQCFEDN